ncbi:translocation/assembly module TamB domain-containing protein [Vulcaniibacterium gelatinicum]|uniref:translocation/assembly module TamB domain-containing protein n=1 Tax=Vulcaniibacterium gelatinicum TaxID=2598725 RepID=UPI0011C84C36|nr:translocation/assembly module TamB domain-containing protein [Vulcaniibacterium gelatinicum]
MSATPAPQAREARIAELRARRRARLRWLALRAVLLAGVLTLAAGVGLWWLVQTVAGRDALLAELVARLPDDATLTWARAEGPARGPLTLHGVRLQWQPPCPDTRPRCVRRPLVFGARRLHLDPALWPLLGRRLRLDALQVQDATLEWPTPDAPFELPRWPEALPDIVLPLALQADALAVDDLRITRDGQAWLHVHRARGGVRAESGRLHVARLVVHSDRGRYALHGDYVPAEDYRTELVATAVLPGDGPATPARLGFVARGTRTQLALGLAGRAPRPLRATLRLRGDTRPHWRLRVHADGFDPGLLRDAPGATPLVLRLQADGVGGVARLSGALRAGTVVVTVLPSTLALEDQVLLARPLALRVLDGELVLRGRGDFAAGAREPFRFDLRARSLRWGAGADAVHADADLRVHGTPARWTARGDGRLTRGTQRAQWRLDGTGDRSAVQLRALQVRMPQGRLDARGRIAWAPAPAWDLSAQLAGFDPGYFVPGWRGAVHARLHGTGHRARDGLHARLAATALGGQLRGRTLRGHGALAVAGDTWRGELTLGLGASRLEARGTHARTLTLDARFAPLQLADVLPDATGTVRGTLALRGDPRTPAIRADLDGDGLRAFGLRAGRLRAHGTLPAAGAVPGTLRIEGRALELGLPLDALRLDAHGTWQALHVDAQAHNAGHRLTFAGDIGRHGRAWRGRLDALALTPARGSAWRLDAPATSTWEARRFRLSPACLGTRDGGRVCVRADWPQRELAFDGHALPLSLLAPWLPPRVDGRPWGLRGEIAFAGDVRPAGRGWRGEVRVDSASGGLKFDPRDRREPLRYAALALHARFDAAALDARLQARVNDSGDLAARLRTGWDAAAPLAGELTLRTDDVAWLELFSPDIVAPRGRLDARLAVSGTRARPRLGGHATLDDFATELPALGIAPRDGQLRLDAQPDGSARLNGQLRSGEGVLRIEGTLGWQDAATPLRLSLRGERVLLADTRALRAVAAPDVQLRYAVGLPVEVSGEVAVTSARLDLERLDSGVPASPDVVVLDPADPARAPPPLALDLVLRVGDDVSLRGFGLDGTLRGRLRVRQTPGRAPLATGQLDVAGHYIAYGQKLQITRGRLAWDDAPFADPRLDLRAQRRVGEVTAGLDVRGRASAPRATVWSDPARPTSEALAYLALGRPLASASREEAQRIGAAHAALTAGGNLLASELGARLGLDDAGVSESRTLGGSVLGIGKYLSPRLYVGYGVSLLGTGQVLTLRYLLGRGFDVEIESSTLGNRATLNWRKEK